MFVNVFAFGSLLKLGFILFALVFASPASADVIWVDGDSGEIDGVRFRLKDVDAPETGPVGRSGGAECEAEARLALEAAEFVRSLTRGSVVTIAADYGADRYGRRVVDLEVDGEGVAAAGLAAGVLRSWRHEGRRSLEARPDWCEGNDVEF